MPPFCCHPANREHQIDAWCKFFERLMHHPACPQNPRGLRHHERRFIQYLMKYRVFGGLKQHQGVAGDDVMGFGGAQVASDVIEGLFAGQRIDSASENLKRQRFLAWAQRIPASWK